MSTKRSPNVPKDHHGIQPTWAEEVDIHISPKWEQFTFFASSYKRIPVRKGF